MALKGRVHPKELVVIRLYEGGGPGSCVQSRSTGRGVHCHGELKGVKSEGVGKPTSPQRSNSQGAKFERAWSHGGENRNQTI